LTVSGLRFAPATAEDSTLGLLGFASFLLNDRVRVDGVAVRRKLGGGLTLAWPARTDADGRRHPYLRPIDDETRRALEADVFAALGLAPEAAP
jgi:hypothetical protein